MDSNIPMKNCQFGRILQGCTHQFVGQGGWSTQEKQLGSSMYLGPRWWFHFLFSPLFGEDSHFDEHIFQMGWFNHQLGTSGKKSVLLTVYPLFRDDFLMMESF